MDFHTFVRIVAFRWKIVVAALLACLVGAATLTALQNKTYEAYATILMSLSGAATVDEVYAATQASQQRLSSYAEIAGSRPVAQQAIDQLRVPLTADQLVSMTKVTYTPESLVLRITVTDSDRQRVAALAGAMADQFAAFVPQVEPKVEPRVSGEQDGQAAPVPYAYAAVVERPTVPSYPVSPMPTRNLAVGLVAGVLLAVTLALIRDATDKTVRTRERLDRVSGVPLLAELPRYQKATNSRQRAGHRRSAAPFQEAVRGLRARLLAPGGPEFRSLLMTSAGIDEGAATTALNLCVSLTEIGEMVVLVEAAPRPPVIAGLVGVQSDIGLADVLADSRAVDDAVRPTSHTDLWILASSQATGSGRHFGTAVLGRTVEKLGARFDRVVIAGPPALPTADAATLAGAVEATVLVVRASKTTVDEVAAAVETLRAAGGSVVGTILTDAPVSRYLKAAARAYEDKVSEAA